MQLAEKCSVCGNEFEAHEMLAGSMITPATVDVIKDEDPSWEAENSSVCFGCLNNLRATQIEKILKEEKGRLSDLEKDVVQSIKDQEIITENPIEEFQGAQSFGDRVADKVAEFGGSWKFIICFSIFLMAWMGLNTFLLSQKAFDPFPYILLNLVLSCVTAMQAPIIMMSQNRQAEKDRIKDELEYQVNLKAEIQTRQINRKLDLFMTQQWQKFVEIQQLQNEILSSKSPKVSLLFPI